MTHQVVFIGSSALGFNNLFENSRFNIQDVLCLKNRVRNDLITSVEKKGFVIKTFGWINDFRRLINSYPIGSKFIIYQLDMLVPEDLIGPYLFFNIHRGCLYNNRGPNPDIWPILCGDRFTSLSIHLINEKIDSGILIDTFDIAVCDDDDTLSLKNRLEKGLPQLFDSLDIYLRGIIKGKKLKDGTYRPWVTEADFTIDANVDTVETISRKIRSQRQYNGAILYCGSNKLYVTEILEVSKPKNIIYDNQTSRKLGLSEDTITIQFGGDILTLRLNNNPKYPPPPKFPISKRI